MSLTGAAAIGTAAYGFSKPIINKALKDGQKHLGGPIPITASSLVEFGQLTRVEPITVVDSSLIPYESTTDVLKTLNSIFASYYLAASSVAINVTKVQTFQALNRLNPNSSVMFGLANSTMTQMAIAATEDIDIGSQVTLYNGISLTNLPSISQEARFNGSVNPPPNTSNSNGNNNNNNNNTAPPPPKPQKTSNKIQAVDLQTVSNLSVGQQLTLDVTDEHGTTFNINMSVRLIVYPATKSILSNILTWSEKDNRLSTRFKAYKAGELSFWRDLVFMRDIFAERRRVLMRDNSGIFKALSGRVGKNILSGLMNEQPSAGTISSIMVISEDNLKSIEKTYDGRLEDFRVRQRIMNMTGLMIIAVVDPIEEYVRIYTYSIATPSEFSMRQIKSAAKGNVDIAEIIKMINAGSAPSF